MKNKAALYTPVLLIAVYLLLAAVRFLPSETLGLDDNPYLSVVILQLLIYMVPSLFYCRVKGRELTGRMRIRLPRLTHLLLTAYGAVLVICGGALISIAMYRVFPEMFAATTSSTTAFTAFAMNNGLFDGAYLVVAFAILPAVTEEFLFRGIVLCEYQRYGAGFAAVFSSVVFAMSHFNLARLPAYLFSGLVLSLLLFATRSLVSAMAVHACNNLSVLLLERYVLHLAERQNISMVLFVILIGAVALLALILFCSEAGGVYRGYADEALPMEQGGKSSVRLMEKAAEAYLSPTFLILVVIFITITVSW